MCCTQCLSKKWCVFCYCAFFLCQTTYWYLYFCTTLKCRYHIHKYKPYKPAWMSQIHLDCNFSSCRCCVWWLYVNDSCVTELTQKKKKNCQKQYKNVVKYAEFKQCTWNIIKKKVLFIQHLHRKWNTLTKICTYYNSVTDYCMVKITFTEG